MSSHTEQRGSVVTIGTFDGVHRAHCAILAEVGRVASRRGLPSLAYVFDVPPRAIIGQVLHPSLLLPTTLKERLLGMQVDRVVRASFAEVGELSARAFIEDVLVKRFAARVVVVGEGFRFGKGRAGNVESLRTTGEQTGVDVVAIPALVVDREPISSSQIRRLISSGHIQEARALLGRPPLLFGEVVAGDHLARRLGYPTANLEVAPEILRPAAGIYLVHAFVANERHHGLLYVGDRPTLRRSEPRLEIHLLTPPGRELLHERFEVHILERLREDRAYASVDLLRDQIERDVQRAHNRVARHPFDTEPLGG